MNTDLLAFVLILLLLLLLVEMIILIITILKDNKKQQPPRLPVVSGYGNETAYGRAWHIELWNGTSNTTSERDFSGQLVLGRKTPGTELFWQMSLGTEPSVSREQCVIYDRGGFLLLENLSQVNMTFVNGSPAAVPTPLFQGAQLSMGRSMFYVVVLRRIM